MMKKRTRLKLGSRVVIFLGILSIYAMQVGMETVATTCVAGILTITTMYIGGESYKPSVKDEELNIQEESLETTIKQ